MPFAEVIKARNGLPKGDIGRLLLFMFTDMPPARGGDFHATRLYRDKGPAANSAAAKENYIVMTGGACNLYLNDYKTAAKYNTIHQKLPPSICAELRTSLAQQPREYLFISPATGKPFSRSAFSLYAARLLKRILHKPVTLTILRHMYISNLDFNNLTLREMEEIGGKMGHKVSMQAQYKWVLEKKDPKTGAVVKTCSCDCADA
jgi:hypothetical protein